MSSVHGPTLDEVNATRTRLKPYLVRTPTLALDSPQLDALCDARIFLKLELFQRTGTFKVRGALNNLLQAEVPAAGVTAVSAGNHAVAVACAASLVGTHAKVVMQRSANPARRALAQAYGAQLLYRDTGLEAFAAAEDIVARDGRLMVHPFDGPHVAAATGGIAAELLDDVPDLDAIVVAVGGGGLAGGLASAAKLIKPDIAVIGVEPDGANCMRRSFDAGAAQTDMPTVTIADSLAPPLTTDYTYRLCRANFDDLVAVSDDEILAALFVLQREAKLAVEPAGAAAMAAVLGPLRERLAGQRVGVIVCGACIDAAGYREALRRGEDVFQTANRGRREDN